MIAMTVKTMKLVMKMPVELLRLLLGQTRQRAASIVSSHVGTLRLVALRPLPRIAPRGRDGRD